MTTLNELLVAMSNTPCSILTGFDGLDKNIRTVTALESQKSAEFLKGGEFVLTAGVLFEGENVDKLYDFVEALISRGAIGIGIKIRFIHKIPRSVIELANVNNFTILLLPDEFLWSDFFSEFFKIKGDINVPLIDLSKKSIEELRDLSNYKNQKFNQKFIENINTGAVIADSNYKIKAKNLQFGLDEIIDYANNKFIEVSDINHKKTFNSIGSYNILRHKGYSIIDIILSEDEHLILNTKNMNLTLDEIELISINYNNILNNKKQKMGIEVIARQILDQLAKGKHMLNLSELNSSAHLHNCICTFFYYIGSDIISFRDSFFSHAEDHMLSKGLKLFTHKIEDNKEYICLCIMEDDLEGATDIAIKKVIIGMELQNISSRVYLGKSITITGDIWTNHQQVLICKRYGQILWKDKYVLSFRDIECLALLEEQQVSMETVFELRDKNNNFDAISTLEAFFEHKSIKKAAESIFIHENTMRYRLNKIQQEQKIDIYSAVDSLNLLIKIKLYKLGSCNRKTK